MSPTHTLDPHARLFNDPRRPGRAMLAVWCFCGRFYTAAPENLIRNSHNGTHPCPSCGTCRHCGKPPEADGDHSCTCPNSDELCTDHPRPVAS